MKLEKMNNHNNLSYMKFFGIDIPEEGQLATIAQQEEIKRLIRSVNPVEKAEAGNEINPDGNKIILYLLDGNRTEITGLGQNYIQISQIINEVFYKQIVIQPKLRDLLDNLSNANG